MPEVQPAISRLASPSEVGSGPQLDQSIQDRLSFRQAQGMLMGLTGCTPGRAAQALLSAAGELSIDADGIAEEFLRCLSDGDSDCAEDLVVRLVTWVQATDVVDRLDLPWEAPSGSHDLAGGETVEGDLADLVVVTTPISGGVAVAVRGELDLATGPQLQEAVSDECTAISVLASGAVELRLDLTGVTFLDMAGLRTLASIHAEITSRGGPFMVIVPTGSSPRWLLHYAVTQRWLPEMFDPHLPL